MGQSQRGSVLGPRTPWVHNIEECSRPASARGATMCRPTIRFCFSIARVLDHSLWYADKLVAARAPRRRPTHLCADDELTSVSCRVRQKISTLLGGPFHSGAPRLCLPCLPCRDATALKTDTLCRRLGR